MVATARALCLQPKFLLMDEPSEGLMPSMIETIFETIEKLKNQKVGVLLVEQKIEGTLRVSDRIVFMENGFMREESDPQALAKNPEALAKYVGVKAHAT
jgi:branched-chain amino acid transport system ATP-binding protein